MEAKNGWISKTGWIEVIGGLISGGVEDISQNTPDCIERDGI